MLQFEVVPRDWPTNTAWKRCLTTAAIWVGTLGCRATTRKNLPSLKKPNAGNLAIDAGGNLAYLAPNRVNLNLTQERWPDIVFHETREHSVKLND